jgi:tetratricopeptide (TPR) repeat protein
MDKYNIIDDYLLGRLNSDETIEVEKKIATDHEFAKVVEEYRKIINLISVHEDNRLRRKFADLEEKNKVNKEVKRVLMVRVLSAAAAIAVLLISYFAFFNPGDNEFSSKELASNLPFVHEYFEPPINYFIQRSRGRSVESKISDAMLLYDAGQYKQAAKIFDDLLLTETENFNILFYGGVSYLMSNQPEKALECFMKTETKENNFDQELQWYKSLIYLDTGDDEKAKTILLEIINSGSKYQKNAKEILETIK